ncbi:MAG: tetratricopeptide repeat protein [Pseudomonadota bacterium]
MTKTPRTRPGVGLLALASLTALTLLVLGGRTLLADDLRSTPDYAAASRALAAGDHRRALAGFTAILAKHPTHAGSRLGLAHTFAALGQTDEALSVLPADAKGETAPACNRALRGFLHDLAGNVPAALADYRAAARDCRAAREGHSWWKSVGTWPHERPPAIRGRLRYIEQAIRAPGGTKNVRPPLLDHGDRKARLTA